MEAEKQIPRPLRGLVMTKLLRELVMTYPGRGLVMTKLLVLGRQPEPDGLGSPCPHSAGHG